MKRKINYDKYFLLISDVISYDAISVLKSIAKIDIDISMIDSNMRINDIQLNNTLFNKIESINNEFENSGFMPLTKCRIDIIDKYKRSVSVDVPFEVYMSVIAHISSSDEWDIDYMLKESNECIVRLFDKIFDYIKNLKDDVIESSLNHPNISISLLMHEMNHEICDNINKWLSISRFKEFRNTYISNCISNSGIVTVVVPNSLFRKML